MDRTQFNKVVVPGLFAFSNASYRAEGGDGSVWRQFVEACGKVKSSSRAYEESAYHGGLGTFPAKPEGIPVAYDDPVQGPTKRWTHKTYGLGCRTTEEVIEDSLYPEAPTNAESLARELGSSAAETQTLIVFDLVNSGTGTTTHTAGDGLAIFSASHTSLRSGTWSNLLSPASDPSAVALQTALDAFENTRDDTGKLQTIKALYVLVNPSSAWKLKELLNSAYDPESPNNAINALKERNLQLMSTSFYTDTDGFTLLAAPPNANSGIIVFDRRPFKTARDGDFNTGDFLMKGTFRMSAEINKPSNLFHSAGA